MAEEQQEIVTIPMPLFVMVPRKTMPDKKYIINMNYYRNWHRMTENQIKNQYAEIVKPQVEGMSFKKVELTFTLFKGSKRRMDRANVLSIHEKYFCDALVHAGCLEDDNDDFLEATHYYTGGIDRENPRVEVEIKSHG